MRFFILITLGATLLFACNTQEGEAESEERIVWSLTDTIIIWSADANLSTRKRLFLPEDSINIPEPIINGINNLWPESGIYTKGQRNDTLIIGLKNETWLTDQIGNEGAEAFVSFAALNLLELKGVNHIYFDIRPGVHAAADTWEDQDFADWREIR